MKFHMFMAAFFYCHMSFLCTHNGDIETPATFEEKPLMPAPSSLLPTILNVIDGQGKILYVIDLQSESGVKMIEAMRQSHKIWDIPLDSNPANDQQEKDTHLSSHLKNRKNKASHTRAQSWPMVSVKMQFNKVKKD